MMKFLEDHECKLLEGQDTIAIEKYKNNDGEIGWYHRYENQVHGIIYCPYCGKKLGEEVQEYKLYFISDIPVTIRAINDQAAVVVAESIARDKNKTIKMLRTADCQRVLIDINL